MIRKSPLTGGMIASAMFLGVLLLLPPAGSQRAKESNRGASASVHIKASAPVVWKAMTDAEQFDTTVEKETPNGGTLVKQRFARLPVFGEMAVTFRVITVVEQRLDFEMVHSNCLKSFSGNCVLTPISDNETQLDMHSFVDPALPVPQFLVNQFLSGKLHKRLLKVKKLSESPR
jgi:hypothetical protein